MVVGGSFVTTFVTSTGNIYDSLHQIANTSGSLALAVAITIPLVRVLRYALQRYRHE